MKNKRYIIFTLSIILILGVLGGCEQNQENAQPENQNEQQRLADEKTSLTFGYVQWPGVTVKTHVVKKIADYLGYETKMSSGSQAIVFKGMDIGDIDIFLGNWMPSMKMHFDKYKEKGSIDTVRVNLDEVIFRTAVPQYTWEAGVKSLADLNKYADKFDRTIYGIEPGNNGNLIIKEAIENNIYNLKDWELKASSTAGMLSAAKKHIDKKEWVAFNAWQPHYMNVILDIKYLKDPEGIWGSGDSVYTVVRSGFENESANFYQFLKKFKVTASIQNQWINEYKNKGKEPEVVAEEWIADNMDIVNEWIKDVKSIDGKNAGEVISEKAKG